MNICPSTSQSHPIHVLSLLDARVITGPARGLIHLARHLPPHVHLHIALLAPDETTPLPPLEEAAGAGRLTVHRLIEGAAFDPRVISRARWIVAQTGASVIQSHSYKPHVIAFALRHITGIPWIGFHHGWTAENLKVRMFHGLDRFTLPRADRIVAVSADSEQLVLESGCPPERTRMIPNAVDAGDFVCTTSPDEIRRAWGVRDPSVTLATAVGRLSPEKGQDVLVDAFALVARELPSLHIAFAGDGPSREDLAARVHAHGLVGRVHFLGHQSDVASVYRATDLFVLPSRSEGMPNALLEAMVCGLPAIATSVGGVPEVARDGDTAWIVAPEDPRAMADALVDAMASPSERSVRGARARAHVIATRSASRRAACFLALYEDVLELGSGTLSALDLSEPMEAFP